MRDDVPDLPARPPRTRRAVRQALDVHLAMWLAQRDLPAADRKRLEAEKATRKAPEPAPPLGVIVPAGGLTPEQRDWLHVRLLARRPGAVHHAGGRTVHVACRQADAASVRHDTAARSRNEVDQAIVRASAEVVAFSASPHEPIRKDSGPWAMARYARHRSLPAVVVLPDGTVYNHERNS